MQKRTRIGLLLLAVVSGIVFGRLALKTGPPEPSYLGKPVSYWIARGFTRVPGDDNEPRADSAFRAMGSNAVPFLIVALGKTDGALKRAYFRAYPRMPLALRRKLPPPAFPDAARATALSALTLIGPAAKPAIPAVLNLLSNEPKGIARAHALACLDAIDNGNYQAQVVEAWLRARNDPDPLVAQQATNILMARFPATFRHIDAARRGLRLDIKPNDVTR